MLSEVIKSVILLAFLIAIILEVFMLFIMIEHDLYGDEKPPKTVKKTFSPRKILNQRKENKKKAEEFKRMETLLNNIDAYDGTDFGQKDLD